MPPGPVDRDIVSSRKTEHGDSITIEKSDPHRVWIRAFDGEDEVGLGLSVKDVMWMMVALQVAIDGPPAERPRPRGRPKLRVLQGSAQPRHGPLGIVGRPRSMDTEA